MLTCIFFAFIHYEIVNKTTFLFLTKHSAVNK